MTNLERLKKDVEATIGFYSNFQLGVEKNLGIFCLMGYLMTRETEHTYLVKIIIPKQYPFDVPTAYLLKPVFPAAYTAIPHYWGNGKPCLFRKKQWNPYKHTIKDVVDRTAQWLHKFEQWTVSGEWRGKDAHKVTGEDNGN